jgi:hypothetical protein
MKIRWLHRFQIIAVSLLAGCSLAGVVFAQDSRSEMPLSKLPPRGMFVVRQPQLQPRLRYRQRQKQLQASLQTWNGSFSYNGTNYPYNMVGTAPSSDNSTTVTAYIVPVKIVVTRRRTKYTFDPSHVLSNGKTVTNNTVASPIFDSTTTYDQGGVDVGTTQYIDAFQRANFWGTVQTDKSYHLLLGGPTVLAEQTLNVPSFYGSVGSPFGHTAGLVDINYFDAQLQSIIRKFSQIQPNTFPIFLTYDVYLTESGQCCIGGYHSSEGSLSNPQAYAQFSYVDHPGDFAQDVSALSHEAGEWADDPLVVNVNGNNTPCGILEVGDPLEGLANYGAFPYVLNGFTYNLQDLVTLPYFGAPTNTSVNDWLSFQGNSSLSVCSNGS